MGITMLSHAKWKNNTPNRGIEYQGDIVCFFSIIFKGWDN
jgi:hypothetical protein